MGFAKLEFDPRICLKEFVGNNTKLNLIRRVKGRKSSKNMLVWGENLASLAALKAGSGTTGSAMSVDVILIDPPYNVGGNQGYRNTWKGKSEKERDWAGDHGEFLDFMEPRLKIGKSLLKEDGVMFVNICDGEYSRLKILMDQIFGPDNCMGTIIWNKNQGSAGQHLATTHEYILVYAKDSSKAPALMKEKPAARLMLDRASELKSQGIKYPVAQAIYKKWVSEVSTRQTPYKNTEELDLLISKWKKQTEKKNNIAVAPKELSLLKLMLSEDVGREFIGSGESPYKLLHPKTYRPLQATPSCAHDKPETRSHKKLKHPVTGKLCKVPTKGWKWNEKTLNKMYEHTDVVKGDGFVIAGSIVYGADEATVPRKLQYLDEKMTQVMPTVINMSYGGQKDLPPDIQFSTPKPVALNKVLLRSIEKNDITVLDYFAGSGATAQAVHELNQEDSGTRNWIMIEEMGSTFHNVLLKRCEHFDKSKDFALYELREVGVRSDQLIEVFEQYSFDFLSAFHTLDESCAIASEGMNVLGYDQNASQLVAMTTPQNRHDEDFFEEELAALKDAVKKTKAKGVLVYSITNKKSAQEPWLGTDKSILSGTKCNKLQIVEIPDQLVDEWNEVLTAMAA